MSLVSASSIRSLAEVEPDLVIPTILDFTFESLESDFLVKRTISCLTALEMTSPIISSWSIFPQGAKNIIPILTKLADKINISNSEITMRVLSVINSFVTHGIIFGEVPICDSSDEIENSSSYLISERPPVNLDLESYLTSVSLQEVEYFIEIFFSNIFSLVGSFIVDTGYFGESSMDNPDRNLFNLLATTCQNVTVQTRSNHLPIILNKLNGFLGNCASSKNQDNICNVIASIVSVMPENVFDKILSQSLSEINQQLNDGPINGSDWKMRDFSYRDIIKFHIQISISLFKSSDPTYFIKHRDLIISTFENFFVKCPAIDIVKLASNSMYSFLSSITQIKLKNPRSLPLSIWNNSDSMNKHFEYWGLTVNPDDLDELEFYSPNIESLEISTLIKDSIIIPAILKLSNLTISNNDVSIDSVSGSLSSIETDQILILLEIIIYGMRGLSNITSDPRCEGNQDFDHDTIFDILHGLKNINPNFNIQLVYDFQQFSDFQKTLCDFILKIADWNLSRCIDSSEINCSLVTLIKDFISFHGIKATKKSLINNWSHDWSDHSLRLPGPYLPRIIACKKVVYSCRILSLDNSKISSVSQSHRHLIKKLSKIFFSTYDNVIKECSKAVDKIFLMHRLFSDLILDEIFENLLSDGNSISSF
ncbi:Proteasome activator complex subunit 4 [Smittium mucronatum]|uniref:Proteasome activator complex subunit 4 n=1 Tax=Smittium mucronatum TaxID=133383 RepID=A0A1R0GN82_9FUNG|nr:Proteasome activator complex subunit 4 [Smittium mucronatum]